MIEIIQSNRNDREGKHRTGMTRDTDPVVKPIVEVLGGVGEEMGWRSSPRQQPVQRP